MLRRKSKKKSIFPYLLVCIKLYVSSSQIKYCAQEETSHRLSLPQAASCSCSCGLEGHFNIVEGDEDVFENSTGNRSSYHLVFVL